MNTHPDARSFQARVIALFFAAVAAALSLPASAVVPIEPGPVRLVKVMQLEVALITSARFQVVQGATEAQRNAVEKCTEASDTGAIVNILAAQIKRAMTKSEIDAAIRFYESPAGKQYTLRDIGLLDAALARNRPPEFHFSAAEQALIERFTKTPAGVKLIIQQVAFPSEVVKVVSPPVSRLVETCKMEVVKNKIQN